MKLVYDNIRKKNGLRDKQTQIISGAIIFAVIFTIGFIQYYKSHLVPVKITKSFLNLLKEEKIKEASELCSDLIGSNMWMYKKNPIPDLTEYKIIEKKFYKEKENLKERYELLVKKLDELCQQEEDIKKNIEIEKNKLNQQISKIKNVSLKIVLENRKYELDKKLWPVKDKIHDTKMQLEDIAKSYIVSRHKYIEFGIKDYNYEKYFEKDQYKKNLVDIILDTGKRKYKIKLQNRAQDGWKIIGIEPT